MIKGEQTKERTKTRSLLKLFAFADEMGLSPHGLGSIGACAHGASVPSSSFSSASSSTSSASPISSRHPYRTKSPCTHWISSIWVLPYCSLLGQVVVGMHTGERQATKMRLAYLRSMLDQDIAVFDTEASTGEVINAITADIIVVQDAISEKVGNFMHYISRFVAGFAIGFLRVWQISLVTLSIVPLIAIAGGLYAYVSIGLIARVRKSYVKAGEIAEENTIYVGRTAGDRQRAHGAGVRRGGEGGAVVRDALLTTYKYGKRGGLAKGLGLGSMHCVLFCSWALLVWFTGIIVHKDIANGGDSFTTMLNVVIAGLSLGQAAPNISTFLRARAAAYPIFQMIERNTVNKTSAKTGRTLANVDGHIQFCDVRFSYPSRPDVLVFNGLNLDIPSGKIVALVGGSGSVARKQIGLVNQEPALFATSIRENILYGKDDATLDEINRAAKLSDAITFINHLPDRYDTQVGERGIQLSGGQKQRIAISRAILKNPSILLLDEATSALDSESEKSVQEALDRVMVGRTTVVVAHRLSTIRNADVIAVVHGGRIAETGTHEQLMANPHSTYASLVQLQEAGHLQPRPSFSESGSMGRPLSFKGSRELSGRTMSLGASFRSDKDSISRFAADGNDQPKRKPVSAKKLYSMVRPDWIFGIFGSIGAFVAGAQMPLFALGVTQALVSYYMGWETTKKEVRKIAILFLCGAVLTVFFHVLEHINFGIMGERLTLRVRERMFGAILRNEIGWFDEVSNTSAMLSSRLETDATLLRTIVVDRSTILLQNIGMIVTSLVIAFILNWRITLVVLATYPLMISGHISEKLFMTGYGGNLGKSYLKANMLAAEAVSNIRTVAAFCSEEKVIKLYADELKEPAKRSFRRGQTAGIFYGVSQFFLFSSYALALWYGSVLMSKELASFKSVMKSFMVLIVTALAMGETLALAPDIIKGNQMAASVFEVLDRKTEVLSDVGEDIAKVEGIIELRGVEFRYPSRPDIVIFRTLISR
uniref:ABC transporter B family member 2-like n=1 Tax=Ananas comosus var. bracteatus TaxID=296719 RepID=A0A6V7QQ90_ANACO|nr:unnamed protein product [Ananas comosus var. bracteatus]